VVVAAEGGVLGLKGSGREPGSLRSAFGRDLIEMDPAVGLAVEIDGVVGGEEEARLCVGEVGKNAAGLIGLGREDGVGGAGGDVGELDRPGVGRGSLGGELAGLGEGCSEPGELFAVGREGGSGVVAGGGIEEAEFVGLEVVERDERCARARWLRCGG